MLDGLFDVRSILSIAIKFRLISYNAHCVNLIANDRALIVSVGLRNFYRSIRRYCYPDWCACQSGTTAVLRPPSSLVGPPYRSLLTQRKNLVAQRALLEGVNQSKSAFYRGMHKRDIPPSECVEVNPFSPPSPRCLWQGETPCHKAARSHHVQTLEFLQAVGADMNTTNDEVGLRVWTDFPAAFRGNLSRGAIISINFGPSHTDQSALICILLQPVFLFRGMYAVLLLFRTTRQNISPFGVAGLRGDEEDNLAAEHRPVVDKRRRRASWWRW